MKRYIPFKFNKASKSGLINFVRVTLEKLQPLLAFLGDDEMYFISSLEYNTFKNICWRFFKVYFQNYRYIKPLSLHWQYSEKTTGFKFSFTLYPAHIMEGRTNLVLRHSVSQFPPNFEGISCGFRERRTSTPRFVSTPEQRNGYGYMDRI